ncbi:MAG: hypothetical protein E7033_05110 [Akkermansiaceae bacterium]|nr:hypothetical protein [Akkermansiaceae bacterium]
MRLIPCLAAALCSICLATAAIPQETEQAVQRYIKLAQDLAPILETVTDRDSADAAAKPLYEILPRVYDTRTELTAIQSLTPQIQQELLQQYGKTMQEEWGKVYRHIFRLEKANGYHSLSFFKQFRALCMMLQY